MVLIMSSKIIPIYMFSGNIHPKNGLYKCVRLPALSLEDAKARLEQKYGTLTYCSLEITEE